MIDEYITEPTENNYDKNQNWFADKEVVEIKKSNQAIVALIVNYVDRALHSTLPIFVLSSLFW